MNLRDRDARARQMAQVEFSRPIVMEAGAGTGKTATLVARILSWSLTRGWERHATPSPSGQRPADDEVAAKVLDRIVAITFTERAAAEMAERVTTGLVSLHRGGEPIGLAKGLLSLSDTLIRQRAASLLRRVDHLRVTTIHSFCRSILAGFPLEAGWHPGFQVDADGGQLSRIVEDLLREYTEADEENYPEALTTLFEEGVDLSHLHKALAGLMEDGTLAETIPMDPYPASHVTGLVQGLMENTSQLVAVASAPMETGKRVQGALATLDAMGKLSAELQLDMSPDALSALIRESLDGSTILKRLKDWEKGKYTKGEAEALGAAIEDVSALSGALTGPLNGITGWNPRGLQAAITALRHLLERGQDRCKREGWIPFSMLLRGARDLLVNHPTVAEEVTRKIDQLLIDEFQDTNPTQCDVVRALALGPVPAERPGLYLVGDPKQSIYGWRQADLRAYTAFVEEVRDSGGTKEVLAINYRSVPAILSEVERVHDPLMSQTPHVSPPFERLLPSDGNLKKPGFSFSPWKPVEYWTATGILEDGTFNKDSTAVAVREQEAKALAADLVKLRKHHDLHWKDVAIILRTRSPMETYLRPLREAGIPYLVERDRSYYHRREVIDGLSLLRVISDPHDHVALVGLLRTPWMGVPDAALAPLIRNGVPQWMAEKQGPLWAEGLVGRIESACTQTPPLSSLHPLRGWEKHLIFALQQIRLMQEHLREGRVTQFIRGFGGLLGRYVTEGAQFLGGHRLANLWRMERQCIEAMSSSDASTEEIFAALKKGFLEGRQEEEGVPGDESMDAVRLLTIHSSKGLTFKHVYLVNMHGRPSAPPSGKNTEFTTWNQEPAFCILGWPSALWHLGKENDQLRERGESIRNLYVAMTRPKDRLVLMGDFGNTKTTSPMDSQTFAQLLTTRFTEGEGKDYPLALEKTDSWDCRWLFPALSTAPLSPLKEERGSEGTMDLKQARENQRILATHRQEAKRRMEKPIFQTPSSMGKKGSYNPLMEERPLHAEGSGPSVGALVGTLIHEFLERLSQTEENHYHVLLEQVPQWLTRGTVEEKKKAVEGALSILEVWKDSALMKRFMGIEIRARELPLLITSGPAGDSTTLSGTIDLLYQDTNGHWVVADYKSDHVPSETSLEVYGERYLQQGALYVQAVQEALGLSTLPRFELWFLRADRIVTIPESRLEAAKLPEIQ